MNTRVGWVRVVTPVFNLRRFGGFLGLAALALQLVLSFGHTHHHERVGPAGVIAAGVMTTGHDVAQSAQGDADEYCAICASIFLASSSFVPDPPQLPLPILLDGNDPIIEASAALIVEARRAPFQSRAPPLA